MIPLKTTQEIEIMRAGGRKLRQVLEKVLAEAHPGITTAQLDQIAEEEIKRQGGEPSFKMVRGYFWSSCLTINNEVVHGIPGEKRLKAGDVLGVDIGMYFKGFHTDLATTVILGSGGQDKKSEFLAAGRRALDKAIKKAKVGNRVGDLSLTIQKEISSAGFAPVQVLTGHGVGRKLHEEPMIPCFGSGDPKQTPQLKEGMTLAIEVIYNQGTPEVVLTDDGWTFITKDGKISALFEETVAVTGGGPLILTR